MFLQCIKLFLENFNIFRRIQIRNTVNKSYEFSLSNNLNVRKERKKLSSQTNTELKNTTFENFDAAKLQ